MDQVCLADAGCFRRGSLSNFAASVLLPKSRTKLKLGLETKPPEEQFAAAKAWLAERRALLVLDDIWENDVKALVLGPPVLVALHVASAFAAVDFAGSFAGSNELLAERGAVDFPNLPSTMRLLRNIVTRWLNLRSAWCVCPRLWLAPTCCEASLITEAARGLQLERLRNEVHDVPDLLRRAVIARPEQQRRLLNAMAVCAPEGFWLLLTVEIAGLTVAEARDARNRLVDASLPRMPRVLAGGDPGSATFMEEA